MWCLWRGKIGDYCVCQRMAEVRVWGLKGLSLGGLAFTVECEGIVVYELWGLLGSVKHL